MSDTEKQLEEARRYINNAIQVAMTQIRVEQALIAQRLELAEKKRDQAERAARAGDENKALDLIDDIELLGEDVEGHAPEIAAKLKETAVVARAEMKIAQNPPGERDWFRALTAGKGAMTLIATLNNMDLEERLGNFSRNGLSKSIERKYVALTEIAEKAEPNHPVVIEAKQDIEKRKSQLPSPPPVIVISAAPPMDEELRRMSDLKFDQPMDFRPR